MRLLKGVPLLAYAISAALDSGVFSHVIVSTDSHVYAEIAHNYGAWLPFLRPAEFATDTSPDIDWVHYTLQRLYDESTLVKTLASSDEDTRQHIADAFAILRPTSPFRTASTIQRAWTRWLEHGEGFDSMRAVEKCTQHPGKMWMLWQHSGEIVPVLSGPVMMEFEDFHSCDYGGMDRPYHSRQYQDLPEIYAQNASLEIAWVKTVFDTNSIAGHRVLSFLTEGYEGVDINRSGDWDAVEMLIEKYRVPTPEPKTRSDYWRHNRNPKGEIGHIDRAGNASNFDGPLAKKAVTHIDKDQGTE